MIEGYGTFVEWPREFTLDQNPLFMGGTSPDFLDAKVVFFPADDVVLIRIAVDKAMRISRSDLHFLGVFAGSCERHRVQVGLAVLDG